VSEDGVKLTTYFGERARADGAFTADALADIYARHRLQTGLVLRGVEGFGAKHRLRTDRLLTLSEDLPLVSVAVDRRERIDAALAAVRALPRFSGLITLERARLLADADALRAAAAAGPADADADADAVKLTVYVGRRERVADGRSADRAVVEALRRRGVAGATVLLGIDGTARGIRHRARFFSRNADVPLMVVAVGDADRIGPALGDLAALLPRPLATLERVQICKRDGRLLEAPRAAGPAAGRSGTAPWQKLMVYASERSQHDGAPLHRALVRELRRAGAAGATSLRGTWGYHGDHAPHGDELLQLRRRVPTVVTVIDAPERVQAWFALVDRLTDRVGLVTSEVVPTVVS
jgi:PII-like signaling protein